MNDDKLNPDQTLLSFPCDFTIKVFGLATEEFETTVIGIINKHVKSLKENAIHSRSSENGKYLALSITIEATSKAQLDQIYQDLSSSKHVIMAL